MLTGRSGQIILAVQFKKITRSPSFANSDCEWSTQTFIPMMNPLNYTATWRCERCARCKRKLYRDVALRALCPMHQTQSSRYLIGFFVWVKNQHIAGIDNVFFWINPVKNVHDLFHGATSTEEQWRHHVFWSLRTQRPLLWSRFPLNAWKADHFQTFQ
jgi:hypothetical protein